MAKQKITIDKVITILTIIDAIVKQIKEILKKKS
jgi:hypothetical protein